MCSKTHFRNGFTRLTLERDNAGIEKIYQIDQLEAMKLESNAWTMPRTLCPGIQTATREAATLQAEALQCLKLLELKFQQMVDRLPVSGPTKHELKDEEIVGEVTVSLQN
ncbi:hypothetical protein FRC10_002906 [Ceratobasidium sp. 414]|nr:hypothetical protein FRC10_002906 [Ceratobasidium sp. 414]